MVQDVFDMSALGKYAPRYLDLDSLRDALPTPSEEIAVVEDDRMDVDSELVLESAPSAHASAHPEKVLSHPEKHPETHISAPVMTTPKRSALQKVMSPTQSGARMALRDDPEVVTVRNIHRRSPRNSEVKQEPLRLKKEQIDLTQDESEKDSPQTDHLSDHSSDHTNDHAVNRSTSTTNRSKNHSNDHSNDHLNNHLNGRLSHPDTAHNSQVALPYEIRMPMPPPWHENLPYTLSTYLQVLFNLGVLACIGWLAFTLNKDVSMKMEERSDRLLRDAQWCQQQFLINRCHSGGAPPHLVESKACLELEHCMEIDPSNVRRITMYASLFAEVVNELVQPIEFRTTISMAITLLVLGLGIFSMNYVFGFLRARTYFLRGASVEHPIHSSMHHPSMHHSSMHHPLQSSYDQYDQDGKVRVIGGPNNRIWR